MLEDMLADLPSLPAARFLVETEVDAAKDSRVVNVIRDFREHVVIQDHARDGRCA